MFVKWKVNGLQITEYKLDFTNVETEKGEYPVIIVAAGSSLRMQGTAKQFVNLSGIPAIVHTLSAFENSPEISRIILVTKQEYINEMQLLAEKYMISKLSDIVEGGVDRQSSVKCGLSRLSNESHVLIHDGARPLVTEDIISRVCASLKDADGVVCAVPVKDTVKYSDESGFVTKTISRDSLYSVQTPQGVNVKKYNDALSDKNCSRFTDDASILEAANMSVKIVMGDYSNIKLTTPEDIALAEYYLERRGN